MQPIVFQANLQYFTYVANSYTFVQQTHLCVLLTPSNRWG